jgi:hypothetical protein
MHRTQNCFFTTDEHRSLRGQGESKVEGRGSRAKGDAAWGHAAYRGGQRDEATVWRTITRLRIANPRNSRVQLCATLVPASPREGTRPTTRRCLPFRPASRRAVQASGLCYPESNFQTRSKQGSLFCSTSPYMGNRRGLTDNPTPTATVTTC